MPYVNSSGFIKIDIHYKYSIRLYFYVMLLDPQTSISPKIKKEELAILIGKSFMVKSPISIVCSAQGFPIPYFWYVS